MNSPKPSITVISDCYDDAARVGQTNRWSSLFGGVQTTVIGLSNTTIDTVDDNTTVAASGLLLSALDAVEDRPCIVAVNIAPRHSVMGEKWENGTPFAYFWYKQTLVLFSIDGHTLSMVKKFSLVDEVYVMDIAEIESVLIEAGLLSEERKGDLLTTQFRSYEFLPRIGKYLWDNKTVAAKAKSVSEFPDVDFEVWWVDNFGNVKTSFLPEDVEFQPGKTLATRWGNLACYPRMKDVPDNEQAVVIGSSGIGKQRLLEVIIQGKPAAAIFDVDIGGKVLA